MPLQLKMTSVQYLTITIAATIRHAAMVMHLLNACNATLLHTNKQSLNVVVTCVK